MAERALWRIVPGEVGQSDGVGIIAFTHFANERALSPVSLLGVGVVFVVGSGALLGYLITVVGQWLRLDPCRHSRRALWDALAQWRSSVLWASPFLIAIAISVWRESRGGSLDVVAPIVAIVATFAVPMLAPFLVYDRRVLEGPSPRRLWVPRWPGWRVVLAGLAIALLDSTLATILEFAQGAAPVAGEALIAALISMIGVTLATLLCIAWIDREGFRAFVLPWTSSSARSAFGPQFALCVRVAYLGLCLLPLLILPSAFAIFVLPQVEDALQHEGMASPSIFRLARAVRLDVTNPIMTVMAVMVAPMLAFATARTYVLSASTAPDN